ncbi:MAG: hypothetical protein SGBAC_009606 [Bacillariaceae sp.]
MALSTRRASQTRVSQTYEYPFEDIQEEDISSLWLVEDRQISTSHHNDSPTGVASIDHTGNVVFQAKENDGELPKASDLVDPLTASLRHSSRSDEVNILERSNRTQLLIQSKLASCRLNKLKVDDIGLVGRDKEVSILKERLSTMTKIEIEDKEQNSLSPAVSNLVHSKDTKEIVFLKGYSGVGKTSLARSVEKEVRKTPHGCYVEGKFDLNASKTKPYDGIANAFSQLFQWLKARDVEALDKIGQELCAKLGAAVEPLTYLIPELHEIVKDYLPPIYSDDETVGMQERWKFGFRVLTRLLTSKVNPLVIVIDDLQWGDHSSLELIEHLICDVQNPNPLMVIGCYRQNELVDNSDLETMIRSLTEKRTSFFFNITDIEVECCNIEDVSEMISRMMDTDRNDEVKELAELCFRRTLGNPFFAIEFMAMLHREKLLKFNFGTMKWMWDMIVLQDATMSTANVVDLLQARIQNMPQDLRLLLQFASCLGPSFRISTLEMVWKNRLGTSNKQEEKSVSSMIKVIQEELLVESSGEGRFRFVHDNVQDAALHSVSTDIAIFQYELGRLLFDNLSSTELEDDLFDVADLLIKGGKNISAELASYLLAAAQKAKKVAAFHSASTYIASGIGMLPENKWTSHRSLSVKMYVFAAKIEFSIGSIDRSEMYKKEVFLQEGLSLEETLPLRLLEAHRLGSVDMKHEESVDYCLELLDEMGYRFFRFKHFKLLQVLPVLPRTIEVVKNLPEDFHTNLGRMTDKKKKAMAGLLYLLLHSAFLCHRQLLLVLSVCKIVEFTLEHGLCEYSAPAFAWLSGILVTWRQDFKGAAQIAENALAIQQHYGRTNAAMTSYVVYGYCLAWSRPLHECAEPYFQIYISGMREGNIEYSLYALIVHFLLIPYVLGKPLSLMLEECPKILAQAEGLKHSYQTFQTKCYRQVFLNLSQPNCPCPHKLEGESISAEEIEMARKSKDTMLLGLVHYYECQLLLFFDDPSFADRAIKDRDVFSKYCGEDPNIIIETFHRGVCLYTAACRTKKRRYKKYAMVVRKTIAKWKQAGNPNVIYYCFFLDAMHFALKGKHDQADALFQKAIVFVCRSGYLHHAGLFNELYAEFLRDALGDSSEYEFRMFEAIRCYRDWGALAKVQILKKRLMEQSILSCAEDTQDC